MTSTNKPKILIVEDEMIIAADLSLQLTKLNYDVIGIQTRAEDALKTIEQNRPDLILMDINLAGEMNGIEASAHILNTSKVPVIFLTSNTDDASFQKAIETKPYAFLSKPFQKANLERGIELALKHIAKEKDAIETNNDHVTTLNDRLFIRQKNQMVKVSIGDILFLEADRNYCKVYLKEKTFLVSTPLGTIEQEVPRKKFVRVHRSFIINVDMIDAVGENFETLTIQEHTIPISRRNREELMKYLKMI